MLLTYYLILIILSFRFNLETDSMKFTHKLKARVAL